MNAAIQSISCLLCRFEGLRQTSVAKRLGLLSEEQAETLVLYAYSNSDSEYERNLHYFVQHGMAEGDGCEYAIIVQEVSSLQICLTTTQQINLCHAESA